MTRKRRKTRQQKSVDAARSAPRATPSIRLIEAPPFVSSEKLWNVLVTKPGMDAKALRSLMEVGATVWMPSRSRQIIRLGRKIEKTLPLMPGYVFLSHGSFVGDWKDIDGIRGFLSIGDAPALIGWAAISRLVDYLAAPVHREEWLPSIGDFVHVTAGALIGKELRVTSIEGNQVRGEAGAMKVRIGIEDLAA